MKIVIIAHCQGLAFANCVRALLPDHDVYYLSIYNAKNDEGKEQFIEWISSCDLILTIPLGSEWGPLATEKLTMRFPGRVRRFPAIAFGGYHPDISYIYMPDGSFVGSPLGDYNSTIAAAAYAAALPAEDALDLYNSLFFNRLGYFQEFERAKQWLLSICRSMGYDLSAEFDRWVRQGSFMHSVNHPKIIVSASIACETLRIANIPFDDTINLHDIVPDDQMNGPIWPVYPEISHRLGCSGSYIFKAPNHKNELWNYMDICTFVHESYRMYENIPKEVLLSTPLVRKAFDLMEATL